MEKFTVFEAALEGDVIGVNLPKSIHFLCDDINKEARGAFRVYFRRYLLPARECLRVVHSSYTVDAHGCALRYNIQR